MCPFFIYLMTVDIFAGVYFFRFFFYENNWNDGELVWRNTKNSKRRNKWPRDGLLDKKPPHWAGGKKNFVELRRTNGRPDVLLPHSKLNNVAVGYSWSRWSIPNTRTLLNLPLPETCRTHWFG
jgi:hypothetical protein